MSKPMQAAVTRPTSEKTLKRPPTPSGTAKAGQPFSRVGDGDDGELDIRSLAQGIVDDHECAHGVESGARFGDDDKQEPVGLFLRRGGEDVADEVAGSLGIEVVAAEVELGVAAPRLRGTAVPEFAAVGVEEDAVAEVGAADAEVDGGVGAVAEAGAEGFEPGD